MFALGFSVRLSGIYVAAGLLHHRDLTYWRRFEEGCCAEAVRRMDDPAKPYFLHGRAPPEIKLSLPYPWRYIIWPRLVRDYKRWLHATASTMSNPGDDYS